MSERFVRPSSSRKMRRSTDFVGHRCAPARACPMDRRPRGPAARGRWRPRLPPLRRSRAPRGRAGAARARSAVAGRGDRSGGAAARAAPGCRSRWGHRRRPDREDGPCPRRAASRTSSTSSEVSRPRWKSAEPTMQTSMPWRPTTSAVLWLTPPSTWTSPPRPAAPGAARLGDLGRHLRHEALAAPAGLHGHDHDDVEQRRPRRRPPRPACPG